MRVDHDPPSSRLQRARAAHSEGEQLLAEGAPGEAADAARAGLAALGENYCPHGIEDDTEVRLFAAEERIAKGRAADGARLLLRTLDERTRLYGDRHRLA